MTKWSLLALCVMVVRSACAETTLNALFDDHAVLQRDMPVNVWGRADKGDTVTVAFAGQTKTAKAADDGSWLITLDAMRASTIGRMLTVT